MPAERNLPTPEAEEIVGLARSVAREQLAPRAAAAEEDAAFPRDVFRTLGELGFLGMPYPEEVGGAGQPYEVYLQALEEISAAWASVGVGLSRPRDVLLSAGDFGTDRAAGPLAGGDAGRRPARRLLPLGGRRGLRPGGDADRATPLRRRRARRADGGYRAGVSGSKAWVTHGGEADFYTLFARTSEDRSRGISCFLVPGDAPGLTVAAAGAQDGADRLDHRDARLRRGRARAPTG